MIKITTDNPTLNQSNFEKLVTIREIPRDVAVTCATSNC